MQQEYKSYPPGHFRLSTGYIKNLTFEIFDSDLETETLNRKHF